MMAGFDDPSWSRGIETLQKLFNLIPSKEVQEEMPPSPNWQDFVREEDLRSFGILGNVAAGILSPGGLAHHTDNQISHSIFVNAMGNTPPLQTGNLQGRMGVFGNGDESSLPTIWPYDAPCIFPGLPADGDL